jgi:hypothetical protein
MDGVIAGATKLPPSCSVLNQNWNQLFASPMLPPCIAPRPVGAV